jgi:hypothetical protein
MTLPDGRKNMLDLTRDAYSFLAKLTPMREAQNAKSVPRHIEIDGLEGGDSNPHGLATANACPSIRSITLSAAMVGGLQLL